MKWTIYLLFGILFASAGFADEGLTETFKPNEVFGIPTHLINRTGDVVGANCSIQIMNSSYGILTNSQMKEIGGGWYNFTYNTSKTGNYLCRQNCTQGTVYGAAVCDFTIKGDKQVPIAIIIVMGIVITVLFILSRFVQIEALKYLLISISAIMTIITLAIGLFLAQDSLPTSVQNLMSTAYIVLLYTLDFIIGIGFIFILFYYITKWLPTTFKMKKK